MQKSRTWVHKSTFILATAGAAIGLGNIWKFPYLVGENGGGAFVLVYLLCVFVIGLPLIVVESVIGRHAQKNPIDAVLQIAKESGLSRAWAGMSVAGMVSLILIFSFFSVIGGWTLNYAIQCFMGSFNGLNPQQVSDTFVHFLGNDQLMIWLHLIFALLTCFIVMFGVVSGVERGLRFMMPLLFLLIIGMLAYSFFFTDHFNKGLRFMFMPDFSKITHKSILAALGQAFFSLNVGVCVVMAYAAYTSKSVSLVRSAGVIVFLDTLVALSAGLIIFPIVFSFGLKLDEGPSLFFISLTSAFAQMPFGNIIGGVFFFLVAIAGLTSSVSMLEAPSSVLEQRTRIPRIVITPILSLIGWAIGLATVFSFNRWSDMTWLNKTAFEWIDILTSGILLPLTGLALLIFTGWKMSDLIRREQLGKESYFIYDLWLMLIRYVAPVLVSILFVYGLLQFFVEAGLS